MSEFIQVVTTTGSREQADHIASELVDRRLAACVQVSGPIVSCYRWKGIIERSTEWRCEAKAPARHFEKIAETIRSLHDYDEPEIIATRIDSVSPGYGRWLDEECA